MGFFGFLSGEDKLKVTSFGLEKDSVTASVLKAFASAPKLITVEVVNIIEGDVPDDRSEYQKVHRKYKYHLDKLVEGEYLVKRDKTYVLTEKGREFLVAAGFSIPDLWANPVLVPVVLVILASPFVLIGLSGWEYVWYSVSPGVPSVVEHSVDVSKYFLGGGCGLAGIGIGVILGRFYAR